MNRLLRLNQDAIPPRTPSNALHTGNTNGSAGPERATQEGVDGPDTLGPDAVPVYGNMAGDYGYLSTGYYASLDAELDGVAILPTPSEALDAYVVPIAMAKARLAGMLVPDFHIVTDRFPPPPLLAYPINPFSSKGEVLPDAAAIDARRKGLTYTGKYAVLVQELPGDHRIDLVRCVLGRTSVAEYALFAQAVYEVFRVPLMRVRVIVTAKTYLLSAIEPLPFGQLTPEERAELEMQGTWFA